MLNFAINTAREAGRILAERFGRARVSYKQNDIDLVTEADLAAEAYILGQIGAHYPRHAILAEESGVTETAGAEYRWIIDPLDGTTNYAHGYPCFCVSIGLEHNGELIVGAVYDPTRDEMFAAEKGAGAMLNGRRMRVSQTEELKRALVCTGFPYNVRERHDFMREWRNFTMRAHGVRRDGSAALDLAYVAAGRFDAFWEDGLNPWDMAAGALLVAEAGGLVTNYRNGPLNIYQPPIVASNGLIHESMLEILRLP
jgi:myo-inositol-1(or 4)-monophosphatase